MIELNKLKQEEVDLKMENMNEKDRGVYLTDKITEHGVKTATQ